MGLIESFRVCGMVVAQVNAGKLVSVIAGIFRGPVTDDGFPNSFHLGGQGGMKRERKILRHMVLAVLLLGVSSGTRVPGQAQQFAGETDRSFVNDSTTKTARENYQRALSQYQAGRYQEALSSLQEALKLDPNFAIAHNSAGVVYDKLGRSAEAINSCERAVVLKPDLAVAHYNLGVLYDDASRTEEAIRSFTIALRLDPGDARAHFGLACINSRRGRYAEAIDDLKIAIALRPNYAEALN